MKLKQLNIILVVLALLGMPLIIQSCGSSPSPAGVPVPPVETPSPIVLKMVNYDDIAIDVSRLTQVGVLLDINKAIGLYSDISMEIQRGANDVAIVNDEVARAIGRIASIGVPWGIPTYQGTMADETGTSYDYAVDFAAYDYNGSGDAADDNCSGLSSDNDVGQPICGRVWRKVTGTEDWERLWSFVFDAVKRTEALDAIPVKARMKYEKLGGKTQQVALDFDQVDPTHAYIKIRFRGTESDSVQTLIADQHFEISREGTEGSALKTLKEDQRLSMQIGENEPTSLGILQYYGQYRDDGDYWRGSDHNHLMGSNVDFDFACASIYTGIVIEDPLVVLPPVSLCASISTDPIEFADPIQASDFEFFDFPLTPTL